MKLRDRIAALLGVSAYTAPPTSSAALTDSAVEKIRKMLGGQLTPLPTTQTRWYLHDLESAIYLADTGDLSAAARLWRAMRRDGVLAGLLATRTRGVVGLPKTFSGDEVMSRTLEGRDGARSVFDAICPPSELAAMAADGLGLGVAVGELVPVDGRDYPVLVRRDPEFLRFRWAENRWYFQTVAGPIPITPGDGRWVLHVDGSRDAPWQAGLWPALGAAWIRKTHANLHQANWEAKLANPARAAVHPNGASESQIVNMLQSLIAWGVNTTFSLPPGWDVKIIESNGIGYESFGQTIERSEREYMIAIAGQIVSTEGGTGFLNADVFKAILADHIRSTADAVAFTINTQVLPQWADAKWNGVALEIVPVIAWDTTPPKDQKAAADAMSSFGKAIAEANAALAPYGKRVDALELAYSFGLPLEDIEPAETVASGEEAEQLDDTTTDEGALAEVIDLDAVRAAYGSYGATG